jgi:hypothetical protein
MIADVIDSIERLILLVNIECVDHMSFNDMLIGSQKARFSEYKIRFFEVKNQGFPD